MGEQADRVQMLLEAERRGILPPEQQSMLDEARRRGLVPAPLATEETQPQGFLQTTLQSLTQPTGMGAFGAGIAEASRDRPETVGLSTRQEFQQSLRDQPVGRELLRGSAALALGVAAGPLAAATRAPLLAAEIATGAAGEVLGQQLVGERDPAGVLLSGAMPLAMRPVLLGLRATARGVGRMLPGSSAALQEDAITRGRALFNRLRPADRQSLQVAAQAFDNLDVPLAEFQQTAADLQQQAGRLGRRLRPTQALRIVDDVNELVQASQSGALPLRAVRDNLEEIGAEIGRFRRATADQTGLVRGATRNLNALRKTYASLLRDLDNLPANAPEVLRRYRDTLRQDFGVLELDNLFERVIDERAGDALPFIRQTALRRAWDRAKRQGFVRQALTPEQFDEIDAFFAEVNRLPPLPRQAGIAAGSAMLGTRTLGAGGIVTGITGDPTMGALAGGIAAIGPRVIARALMTPVGRSTLRRVFASGGQLTPAAVEALAAATGQGARLLRVGQRQREALNQTLMEGLRGQQPTIQEPR